MPEMWTSKNLIHFNNAKISGSKDQLTTQDILQTANDKNETEAIKTVLGEKASEVVISSTKSMTGHLLGGGGAFESMASILSIKHSKVPPTINLNDPDEECDLNYTPNNAVDLSIKTAMSNSFGFGGHNAVLVFKKS